MKRIDGSQGEGGGQILRTSLSLSMITGTAFRIDGIRAGRKKPGLLRQHLAAVKAAATICSAKLEGAELGSTSLTFVPGAVRAGNFQASVGSAGSGTLVLQTVLPALMMTEGPSTLVIEGGTHNPMAPPVEFLSKAFLPQLAKLGPSVELRLERAGFFPAGGGRFHARITPQRRLGSLTLLDRGTTRNVVCRALVAGLPKNIAERECIAVRDALGLPRHQVHADVFERSPGPGNVVLVEVDCAHVSEVFTGFGERGVLAEDVAKAVAVEAGAYLRSRAATSEYLTDQLLLPMALGQGGAFRAQLLSQHTRTQLEVLDDWLGTRFELRDEPDGTVVVEVRPGSG